MQKKAAKIFIIFLFVLGVVSFSGATNVFAARKDFAIVKLDFKVKAPLYKGATTTGAAGAAFNSRKWGVVETLYESEQKWADNVLFKYFVMFEDGKKDIMLSEEIAYMNVPKDKRLKSCLYIHPAAMIRYGKLVRLRVELWHEGVMVDSSSWPNKGKANWWLKTKGIEGQLLNKYYTPFSNAPDNECQIKMNVK